MGCSKTSTRDTTVGASTSCSAFCVSRRTERGKRDEDSVLESRRIQVQERTHQLVHRLRHRTSRQHSNGNDNLVHGVPQNLHLRPGQGRHPVRPRPAGLKSSGWDGWPCSSSRAPTPWPWHSSVPVRNGAYSLPGPSRRSSAHVSAMSRAVAPFSASLRSCKCRQQRKPSSHA